MPFIPSDQLATRITIASFASSLIRIFKHGLECPVNLIHTHDLAVKWISEADIAKVAGPVDSLRGSVPMPHVAYAEHMDLQHFTEDDHVPALKPRPTLFTAIPVKSEPLNLWRNDTQALNSGSAYGHDWNPSVGLHCAPWHDWTSYCVVDKAKLERFSATAIKTTTTTSKTLPASTTSTTLAPSPTVWRNLGCYIQDAQYPVLGENVSPSIAPGGLTVPKCKNTCYTKGYDFAGVQGGNLCFCGSFVEGEWTGDQADCNTPCIGDTKSFCGGNNLINAFRAEDNSDSAPSMTSTLSLTTAATTAGMSAGTAGDSTASNSVVQVTQTAVSNSGASRRFGYIFF
ncbi:WSC domain-containing protein 2 [Elsinoe australis]|uniref:WSC domain-containing protein 2 n=1 Tax=Elsinoe australis TaxID=40998 RepID=A0A2P7ZAE3_9PEZI|nr:WSC domain-containing protein 2 [Elsinoe australis]